MLYCYTLSLLSLSLTPSIIIIIIIIIIFVVVVVVILYYFYYKCYLEEKEKAMGWEGGFTNKTV